MSDLVAQIHRQEMGAMILQQNVKEWILAFEKTFHFVNLDHSDDEYEYNDELTATLWAGWKFAKIDTALEEENIKKLIFNERE